MKPIEPDADLDSRRPTIADLQRSRSEAQIVGDYRRAANYDAEIARRLEAAQADARGRLAERRNRVSTIRRRVTAGAVGLFAAATAGLTIQLVSGHDPALATSVSKSAAPAAAAAAEAPTPDSSATAATDETTDDTTDDTTAIAAVPSPVTTQQS